MALRKGISMFGDGRWFAPGPRKGSRTGGFAGASKTRSLKRELGDYRDFAMRPAWLDPNCAFQLR